MTAGEAWSLVSSGLCCEGLLPRCSQGVYRGAFWAVNRPPCIVEVHTSVAKASFSLGSIFKTAVQIYCTRAHKSQKLKETCSPFWPHCDTFVCEIFYTRRGDLVLTALNTALFLCSTVYITGSVCLLWLSLYKTMSRWKLNNHSHWKWAWSRIAFKIWFLLSALQMCCACAMTLMLALFKYEKRN